MLNLNSQQMETKYPKRNDFTIQTSEIISLNLILVIDLIQYLNVLLKYLVQLSFHHLEE